MGITWGNNHSAADIVFSFKAAILDCTPVNSDAKKLPAVHKLYSHMVAYSIFEPHGVINSKIFSKNLKENNEKLESVA